MRKPPGTGRRARLQASFRAGEALDVVGALHEVVAHRIDRAHPPEVHVASERDFIKGQVGSSHLVADDLGSWEAAQILAEVKGPEAHGGEGKGLSWATGTGACCLLLGGAHLELFGSDELE
jgi:hypothetical protein